MGSEHKVFILKISSEVIRVIDFIYTFMRPSTHAMLSLERNLRKLYENIIVNVLGILQLRKTQRSKKFKWGVYVLYL